MIRLSFSSKNEKYNAYFINKLVSFTSGKVKLNLVYYTRKLQPLFPLTDKGHYLSCVIYKGICSCGETYVGETIRNCKIRWDQNNDANKNSKLAQHSWCRAPEKTLKRRILEAYFIKLIAPSLQCNNVMLFRNGVIWR